MKSNSLRNLAGVVGAVVLCAGLISSSVFAATLINGAGATFPYPLYSKWMSEYQKKDPSVAFNYQSIGSGGGIRQFTEKTVDFGATDAPMSEEELKSALKKGGSVLHVPAVLGAVVVTYNVPGVDKGLKLTPDVLSDIFLGKITKWDDAKIKKLNKSNKLSGTIIVVHRSDGSGTTSIFTDYLAKVSPEWKQKVGAGKAVNWPVGLGGKGNEGVSGLIKQTPGTIGYVELIYAENNSLAYAAIQDKAGQFVLPNLDSVTAAAAGALKSMPADFRVSITDSPGKGAYPISGFTYLLVWKKMIDSPKGLKIVEFLKWALKDGQEFAKPLMYSPLPKQLVAKVMTEVNAIEVMRQDKASQAP